MGAAHPRQVWSSYLELLTSLYICTTYVLGATTWCLSNLFKPFFLASPDQQHLVKAIQEELFEECGVEGEDNA